MPIKSQPASFKMTFTPAIEIQNLSVHYGPILALEETSLQIPGGGHLIGILGPNGAGKSTLLKGLLGLCSGTKGKCLFFGRPLKDVLGKIAYIPQKESIDWNFPISVEEMVMMGRYGALKWYQKPTHSDHALVEECLSHMGLVSLKKRQIQELSGGQKQRAFLARALAQKAEIYLLDEPLTGIDQTTQKAVISLLKTLKEEGKTVLVVHHDLKTVSHFFDWAILMNRKVISIGPIENSVTEETLTQTYDRPIT